MILRDARPHEALPVADFHAASWADAYRGILSDTYLDGPVFEDRRKVWTARFAAPEPGLVVCLGEDETGLLALASIVPGADPAFGGLIDNLHVRPDAKGRGLGKRALHAALARLSGGDLEQGVWLTVYRDNSAARAAYAALGGEPGEPFQLVAPDATTQWVMRYAWPNAARLRERTA